MWVGLHLQIARLTENPEIAISEGDGTAFLKAAQNVLRHYPISASQVAIDWAALSFTASLIYVPRFAAIANRRNAPPPPPPQHGASVYHFHPQGPGNGSGQPTEFETPPPIPQTVDMDAGERE